MKKLKLLSIFAVMMLCLTGLTACGGGFDAAGLLKGNLDVIYLGQSDDSHLKSVNLTKEEAQEYYEEGIQVEAEFFVEQYLGVCYFDDLSDETQQKVIDMYKQIYSHSKYEVGDTSKNGETYLVSLTVYPIDIIANYANEDFEALTSSIEERALNGEFDNMSDEEFGELCVNEVIAGISALLDNVGYLDAETISVQIAKDTDGYYAITDNDFGRIDNLIIHYE